MKGFIVVENFYEHVCCKEKLLKDYKVWKKSDCIRIIKCLSEVFEPIEISQ